MTKKREHMTMTCEHTTTGVNARQVSMGDQELQTSDRVLENKREECERITKVLYQSKPAWTDDRQWAMSGWHA